jgi:hypothetical protein
LVSSGFVFLFLQVGFIISAMPKSLRDFLTKNEKRLWLPESAKGGIIMERFYNRRTLP